MTPSNFAKYVACFLAGAVTVIGGKNIYKATSDTTSYPEQGAFAPDTNVFSDDNPLEAFDQFAMSHPPYPSYRLDAAFVDPVYGNAFLPRSLNIARL